MRRYVLLPLLLLFTVSLHAQNEFFTPEKRLGFANSLFAEKDYLRAADEYTAYLRTESSDTARFKYAWSLAGITRYHEAQDNYRMLFFDSNLEDEARFEFLKIEYLQGNYGELEETFEMGLYRPVSYTDNVNRLIYSSRLLSGNRFNLPDTTAFYKPFTEKEKEEVAELYRRVRYPDSKSASKAAWLSLFPGAGKIYTGDVAEGITAFVAVGLLSFLSYDNFDAGHDFRGWLFGSLAGIFYGGNIYGAHAAAEHYNARKEHALVNDINDFVKGNDYFTPDYQFMK